MSLIADTVCVLSEREATRLYDGQHVNCQRHRHVSSNEARILVLGGKIVPCYCPETYHPSARVAILPNGAASPQHIVLSNAWEWRKRTQRGYAGSPGFATMQLMSIARSR